MKKILYSFYHGAAFAWVLVHKLSVYPDDDAYLLLADGWDWNAGKKKFIEKFIEKGIFKKIYIYDNRFGRDPIVYDTLIKTENAIINGIDKQLLAQKCNISEFDEIYSNTDGEDTLGIWFSLKKINFNWFETSPNLLADRTSAWIETTYSEHKGYKEALLKHKTLFGESQLQSYILYPNSMSDRFPQNKCHVFDAPKAAAELDSNVKELILDCFGLKNFKLPENSAMFYLQSNWLPNDAFNKCKCISQKYKHSWFYMYYCIQCMLDYYLPDNSIPFLKTHPTVIIDEITAEKYFGGAYAFPALYTVLLMSGLTPELMPEYKILLGSSANKQLSSNANDIRCPGMWIFSAFAVKYYTVLKLLDSIDCLTNEAGKNFNSIGDLGNCMNYNNVLLHEDINSMIRVNFHRTRQTSEFIYKIIQTHYVELDKELENNDFLILTDVYDELTEDFLAHLKNKAFIVKIKISKFPIISVSDIIAPLDDEFIYMVSLSKIWCDKVQNFTCKKQNHYAGFEMSADVVSDTGNNISNFCLILNENISLYEIYRNYGRYFNNERGDEITIKGSITTRVIENMKAITVRIGGAGNNKVIFENLNTGWKLSGRFKIEVLNGGTIKIGRLFFANSGVLIHAANSQIILEDDIMIESDVNIRAMNYHSVYDIDGKRHPNKNVHIGKHVWIGWGTTIYAGSVVGNGSMVENGSVVTCKLPNNCIAVGNPARVVRENIFWSPSGKQCDYNELTDELRTVDEYINPTIENKKGEEKL